MWISIDGVEGAGKTTMSRCFSEEFGESAVIVSQFTPTAIGEYLSASVQVAPHFISKSPLAQSLIFIADFIEAYDTTVRSALMQGKVVISDRGYLSKYAYQEVVLSTVVDSYAARKLLNALFEQIHVPDLIVHVYADMSTIRRRLLARDGHCSDERMRFIQEAQEAMCRLAREAKMPIEERNTALDDPDTTAAWVKRLRLRYGIHSS